MSILSNEDEVEAVMSTEEEGSDGVSDDDEGSIMSTEDEGDASELGDPRNTPEELYDLVNLADDGMNAWKVYPPMTRVFFRDINLLCIELLDDTDGKLTTDDRFVLDAVITKMYLTVLDTPHLHEFEGKSGPIAPATGLICEAYTELMYQQFATDVFGTSEDDPMRRFVRETWLEGSSMHNGINDIFGSIDCKTSTKNEQRWRGCCLECDAKALILKVETISANLEIEALLKRQWVRQRGRPRTRTRRARFPEAYQPFTVAMREAASRFRISPGSLTGMFQGYLASMRKPDRTSIMAVRIGYTIKDHLHRGEYAKLAELLQIMVVFSTCSFVEPQIASEFYSVVRYLICRWFDHDISVGAWPDKLVVNVRRIQLDTAFLWLGAPIEIVLDYTVPMDYWGNSETSDDDEDSDDEESNDEESDTEQEDTDQNASRPCECKVCHERQATNVSHVGKKKSTDSGAHVQPHLQAKYDLHDIRHDGSLESCTCEQCISKGRTYGEETEQKPNAEHGNELEDDGEKSSPWAFSAKDVAVAAIWRCKFFEQGLI